MLQLRLDASESRKVFTHFNPPFRVMAYLKQNINVLAENCNIIKNKKKNSIIYIILWLTRTPILNWLFYNLKLEV